MIAGRAFQFYSEGPIGFAPTYKYDIGTDHYDTSYVLGQPDLIIYLLTGPTVRKPESPHGVTVCSGEARTCARPNIALLI